MSAIFKRFLKSRRGGVALMAGLTFPVILLGTVVSLEIANVQTAQVNLQDELDATTIACASKFSDTREQGTSWQECAGVRFREHVEEKWPGSTVDNLTWQLQNDDTILAEATVTIKTLLSILLPHDVDLRTEAVITRIPHVEIALLLDVSHSMRGAPFTNMQAGALEFINTLYDQSDEDSDVFVSILPFGDTVRFPAAYNDWLEPDYRGLTAVEQTDPALNPFFQYQQNSPDICLNGTLTSNNKVNCIPMMAWNGCFADGSDADIISTTMSVTPDFLPDINLMRLLEPEAYRHVRFCPGDAATAVLLEDERQNLLNMISGIDQTWQESPLRRTDLGFGTGTDIAMSWGWRLLNPDNRGNFKESTTVPANNAKTVTKHIVLLSDGQPTSGVRKNDPTRANSAAANLTQICQSIRAENMNDGAINVWSIAYGDAGAVAQAMQDCNAGDGGYFHAGTSDIGDIFRVIARAIVATKSRISG